MRIQASTSFDNVKPEDLARFVDLFGQDVVNVVNGNIEFGANIKSVVVPVTFSSANTDTTVGHNLGKVPTGYFLVGASAAMSIYDGGLSSTSGQITLKSSATGTARVLLF